MIPHHTNKAWLYYLVLAIGYVLLCGAILVACLQSYALSQLYKRDLTEINSTSDRETLRLRFKERTRELYMRWAAVVVSLMTCAFVLLLILGIHLSAPELVVAYLVWAGFNATLGVLIIFYNLARCSIECVQYAIDWLIVCTLCVIILLVAILYKDMQKDHKIIRYD